MTRALEPSEVAVFGADAIIDEATDTPVSQSSLRLKQSPQHLAALQKAQDAAALKIPTGEQLQQLLALIQAGTDPKANKVLVDKLTTAASDARQAVAASAAASEALEKKRFEHLRLMAAEKTKHEAALAAERAAIEQERAGRFADLTEREQGVAKREAELKAASAKLQEQLADVDRRVGLIRQAAR